MVEIIFKNMFASIGIVFLAFSPYFSAICDSSNRLSLEKTYDDFNLLTRIDSNGEPSITKESKNSVISDHRHTEGQIQVHVSSNDFNNDLLVVAPIHQESQDNPLPDMVTEKLYALTFINNTFKAGAEQVAHFKPRYQPISSPLPNRVEFESNSSLSRIDFERLINGINDTSLFVPTLTPLDPHHNSSSSEIFCSFAKLVCSKKEVRIEASKIKPSQSFVGNISNIVRSVNSSSFQRAKNLVQTLNKYGWYMPVHYIFGGAFYETQCTPMDDDANFEGSENTLKAHLKASYMDYLHSDENHIRKSKGRETETNKVDTPLIYFELSSRSFKNDLSSSAREKRESTSHETDCETHNLEKSSLGADGAIDILTFFKKVENEKNWQIIRYIELYPTLLLLEPGYNWEFSECVKILRDNHYRTGIKRLQNQINMEKYFQDLAAVLSPKPF